MLLPPELTQLDELFPEREAFANRAAIGFDPKCRFGALEVPAVRVSGMQLTCTSPTALEAGAAFVASPRTREELLESLKLGGGAVALAEAEGGVLRLTGDFPTEGGSAVFRRQVFAAPLHDFELSGVLAFGSLGARDGLSVSYAPHLGHERQWGGAGGLRVAFLPATRRVHAWLDERLLGTGILPEPSVRAAINTPFAVHVARDIDSSTVGRGESAQAARLEVHFGGARVLSAALPGWGALVSIAWRVGVGGGTAHETHRGDGVHTYHRLTNLTLRMGAEVARAAVYFGVSYNGQDFYPSVEAFAAQRASLALGNIEALEDAQVVRLSDYLYGRPAIGITNPRTGVAGTQVQLRGDLLPFGRGLDASGGYRCRFQALTRARFAADAWAARFDPTAAGEAARDGATDGWMVVAGGFSSTVDAEFSESEVDEHLSCTVLPAPHGRAYLEVRLS